MLRSYNAFKDLLEFKMLTELRYTHPKQKEVRSYKVGVFTVFDTNERPLLAGYALLRSEAPVIIKDALKHFITIHQDQHPSTLLTGGEQFIIDAVRL